MKRNVASLIGRGTRVRHEKFGEGVILRVAHDRTKGPYAVSILLRADVHVPLVSLADLRQTPWSVETWNVPHDEPGFQDAMAARGLSAEDAPFELRPEWAELPIVKAARDAMRSIGLVPTSEPDMDHKAMDAFALEIMDANARA